MFWILPTALALVVGSAVAWHVGHSAGFAEGYARGLKHGRTQALIDVMQAKRRG